MMGGGGAHASSFGDSGGLGARSPWAGGDQSGSSLARDAGVNDVGSQHSNASQTTAPFDQAQADADQDQDQDQDDDDLDEMDIETSRRRRR